MHKKANCKKSADRLISQQYTKAKKAKKKTGQKTFKITNKSSSKQFEFNHTHHHHKKTNVQPAQESKLQEKRRSINQSAVHKDKEKRRSNKIQNCKRNKIEQITK